MDDDWLEIETVNLVPESVLTPEPPRAAPSAPPPEEAIAAAAERDPTLDGSAQEADSQLDGLLNILHDNLTRIAQVVHRIRSQGLYQNLGYETFEAYIRSKELRMSRSFIYQLAKVGEVLENAGIDLEAQPLARELQISKLAQISRLPDPDTHRKILETGRITLKNDEGLEEDLLLNDVPVKRLNAHINEALGLPPRLAPAYDPMPEPSFRGHGQVPGMQNAAAYAPAAPMVVLHLEGWRATMETLSAELRMLELAERKAAIAEIMRICEGIVDPDVPF